MKINKKVVARMLAYDFHSSNSAIDSIAELRLKYFKNTVLLPDPDIFEAL